MRISVQNHQTRNLSQRRFKSLQPCLSQGPRRRLTQVFLTPRSYLKSHTNERWPRLIKDARTKVFSANTSIQVYIGLKIYRSHMKAVWEKRAARGHGMKIMRTTPKFRIDRATRLKFQIPASLIFGGCAAVPPHITDPFCEIALEDFRRELQPLIH
jgi:hypothetical protein